MNKVEKMYENSGIEKCNSSLKDIMPSVCLKNNEDENYKCEDCEYNWYPDFTAEKQIELIKWIAENKEECRITYEKEYKWCTQTDWQSSFCYENFEESLAGLINNLWQDLTEDEQNEIKNILELGVRG